MKIGLRHRILCGAAMILVTAGVFAPPPARAQSIADAECQTYAQVVAQTLEWRNQGIPLASAQKVTNSLWRRDPNLAGFVNASIRALYQDPDRLMSMVGDGRWHELCLRAVMGG